MEGSSIDETDAAVAKELKNDSVEILHERRPEEINGIENEESVENSSVSENSTKTVEKEEEEEWLDILGSGQLKKKVYVFT